MTLNFLQQITPALLGGVTAFGLTFALTPVVRATSVRLGWVGKPVTGRWGRRVVARLGGVAMFVGFASAMLLWVPLQPPVIGLLRGGTLVFAVGLVDDLRRMRPYTKLLLQLIIGCIMVIGGVSIELIPWPWLAVPLSVFWFVFVMNAFNLLDNMDGLAAGIGAIAAGFCLIHAALTQQWVVVFMAAVVVGAALGFLPYNFPPSKIFMGDSGSHLLGLALATLALAGSWYHSTQLLTILMVPLLVLAVPIFDTCFVTIQRLLHRQHPFSGGTDHVSHRLAILGLSERTTVLVLYGLSAAFGSVSLLTIHLSHLAATVVWLLTLTGFILLAAYLAKVKVYELKRQPLIEPAETSPRAATFIETMLLHKRRLLEVLVDFSLIASAYVGAHLLRFETALNTDLQRLVVQSLPIVLVVKLGCFILLGLYRGVWRYVSLPDLVDIFKAVTLGSMCSAVGLLYLWRFEGYSRAVFIIDWLLLFLGVSGARFAERLFNEWITAMAEDAQSVLIIGAGDTGELVLRQTKQNGRWKRRVVGFLDDDPRKQGSRIHGCSVLGTRAVLPSVLQAYQVREVFIAMGTPPADLIQHVQRTCEGRGVRWGVVTALMPER